MQSVAPAPASRSDRAAALWHESRSSLELLSRLRSWREYVESVLAAAVDAVDASAGSVLLVSPDGRHLRVVSAVGPGREHALNQELPVGVSIAGRAAASRQTIWIPDVRETAEFVSNTASSRAEGRYAGPSFITVPWVVGAKLVGLLNVVSQTDQTFSHHDVEHLEAVAPGIAECVEWLLGADAAANRPSRPSEKKAEAGADTAQFSGGPPSVPTILSLVQEPVICFDGAARVTWFNRAAETLFGTAGAALDAPITALPLGSVGGNWPALIERALANGAFVPLTGLWVRRSGQERPHLVNVLGEVFRDDAGALTGGCLVFDDRTKLSELNDRLQEAEHRSVLGSMLSEVAHELHNPLDGARRFLRLARKGVDGTSEPGEYLTHAALALERMLHILDSLLHFSREERATDGTPEALAHILDRYFAQFLAAQQYPQVRVIRDYKGLGPVIPPGVFFAIIDNLVRNACHAMRGVGTLVVYGHRERDTYLLELQDTGPGVPPELRERIFEPFFTTKPYGEGTGLGLAICRKLLESHGGALTCESEPGVGSTFRITLPIASSAA